MTSRVRCFGLLLPALAIAASGLFSVAGVSQAAAPADKSGLEPVEPDMHEFMEYVFQPTFNRLKPAMAAAPADNKGWKTIKADSLILAEAGNLLLIRQPQEKSADWARHSEQVRDAGGQLYKAAKAKDYPAARRHYEAMVENCNACHRQFADGEHILAP
jgi:hypothetical protein